MSAYLIWHKPNCSTSLFVLRALRDAGVNPVVRDYQRDPPSPDELRDVAAALGTGPRGLLRMKDAPEAVKALEGEALLAALAAQPALIERPVVFSPKGVHLCRPKETVFDLLPEGAAR